MHLITSYLHLFILVLFAYSRSRSHGTGPKELTEPTPAEETKPELTEGKPRCNSPLFLDFDFNHYFMLSMLVH
jgi:hypothetical protein